PQTRFYYGGKEVSSPDTFWATVGKWLGEITERQIGNYKEVKDLALQAAGSESDPEKKLRKLYARAQQLRNISFEHSRGLEEIKKEGLKPGGNLADVVKHGYGDHNDFNRLFVGLALAAVFDAAMVWASNRETTSFRNEILSVRQLDSAIATVNLNGKGLFLDPGTKY